MNSSGNTLQKAITSEIPPSAGSPRANSSSYPSLDTGSYSWKETALSHLEGELHDKAFPSHAYHRYCDP